MGHSDDSYSSEQPGVQFEKPETRRQLHVALPCLVTSPGNRRR
jgi:hypothetical protein